MACFHPKTAWLPVRDLGEGLRPVFRRPVVGSDYRRIELPCKRCAGCRLDSSRDWGLRAAHEAQMHEFSCFVTLTYSPQDLPFRAMLRKEHARRFIKAVRNEYRDRAIRYLLVGEYGEKYHRPHYHACLFGLWFPDSVPAGKSQSGFPSWESKTLTRIWGMGRCVINVLGPEVAEYAARYSLKKVGGDEGLMRTDLRTGEEYKAEPEFMMASLKPGIGRSWLEKYPLDVFPHDYCVTRKGTKVPVPQYYLRVLRQWCEDDYLKLKETRIVKAEDSLEGFWNRTRDRLAVREVVQAARLQFSKRAVE